MSDDIPGYGFNNINFTLSLGLINEWFFVLTAVCPHSTAKATYPMRILQRIMWEIAERNG